MTRFAELLASEKVERVHEASLEILEKVGMLVRNREAHDRYARHGCHVEAGSQVVKFPRGVVKEFLQAVPPTFTFHGRDPQFLLLPQVRQQIRTGGSIWCPWEV